MCYRVLIKKHMIGEGNFWHKMKKKNVVCGLFELVREEQFFKSQIQFCQFFIHAFHENIYQV